MNTSKRKNVLATMVGLFATAGGVGSALAQGDEAATTQGRIDEIVVTASKREQKLIDVPISIAVVSGETIENEGIQNISDLSYFVPSLSVWEVSPGFQTVTIRGVGNLRGSSSLVGIYFDEAPVSSLPNFQLDMQTTDLDRVEVLRGPQGTLYGQGSVGGAIRFLTNDPSFDGAGGGLTISSFDTRKGSLSKEFTGVLNLPIIDDVLGVRIAATYKDKQGWIDQLGADAEDINDNELSNVRIKGLWQVSDGFMAKAMIVRHRNSGGGSNVVNLDPVSESNFKSAIDRTLPQDFIDDYDLYNITLTYELDFATLTSISTYIDVEKEQHNESQFGEFGFDPGVTYDMLITARLTSAETTTQEVRLTDNGSGHLEWTLGAFIRDFDARQEADFHFGVVSPGPLVVNDRSFEASAFFGDVSYRISDRLRLGIGTRYFEEDQRVEGEGLDFEASFHDLSSRVYLSFAATNDASLYFSASEGFRSGGINSLLSILAGSGATYEPEQLMSYEAGFKARLFDRRVSFDTSIFTSVYEDYQALAFNPISGQFPTTNVAEAEIKGIELAVHWTPSQDFSLGFNGNLVDAEVTNVNAAVSSHNEGDPLDFVPEYSYSIYANYDFSWSDSVPGFVHLSYSRQGKNSTVNRAFGLLPGTEVFESDSIGFLNGGFGGNWNSLVLEFFGKNILDEDGLTTASHFGQGPQMRPRTFGVMLSYDF